MRRHQTQPRADWQKVVESQGMYYHTADGVPYWDESAYYEFTPGQIDTLEKATYALDQMCLTAVEHVLGKNLLEKFLIPPEYHQYIRDSWEQDAHSVYGRFDLAYDGTGDPKLLEYNADTPTALLEAAVIQWHWLKDCFPHGDQFNSIHERLLEVWKVLGRERPGTMYFTSLADCVEDYMTVSYLRDVAIQAGCETAHVHVEDIGWNAGRREFTDKDEKPILNCFKLYPWEWMQRDQFGPYLLEAGKGDRHLLCEAPEGPFRQKVPVTFSGCRWLEPPWKAILSNKAILPVLWELFPQNPYLLEASFEPLPHGDYVRKPIFGREGANLQVFRQGKLLLQTPGPYEGPAVYQEVWPLPCFDRKYYACIGSWIVDGWACGIGIREDESLITGNLSRFVPHMF